MNDSCDGRCDFDTQYQLNTHPAFRALERFVLGCDFGGTSWTTRAQADRISEPLGLGKGTHLLELGSGSGWPGVYLAGQSHCELTLLDLPLDALRLARGRAVEEEVASTIHAACASGTQLPFSSASFDALSHSDVLCCLPEKREMLEESRRVARAGARMLFYVIVPAEGLGESDMAEAIEYGPPFVATPADYSSMLQDTGWRMLQREAVNDDYLQSLRRMVAGMEADAATFSALMGPDAFRQALHRRKRQVSAVTRGILLRELYLAETDRLCKCTSA